MSVIPPVYFGDLEIQGLVEIGAYSRVVHYNTIRSIFFSAAQILNVMSAIDNG